MSDLQEVVHFISNKCWMDYDFTQYIIENLIGYGTEIKDINYNECKIVTEDGTRVRVIQCYDLRESNDYWCSKKEIPKNYRMMVVLDFDKTNIIKTFNLDTYLIDTINNFIIRLDHIIFPRLSEYQRVSFEEPQCLEYEDPDYPELSDEPIMENYQISNYIRQIMGDIIEYIGIENVNINNIYYEIMSYVIPPLKQCLSEIGNDKDSILLRLHNNDFIVIKFSSVLFDNQYLMVTKSYISENIIRIVILFPQFRLGESPVVIRLEHKID